MLRIKKYEVERVSFGEQSNYSNRNLVLDKSDIKAFCLKELEGYALDIEIAVPDKSVRIIHITDTVKPAWKRTGATFPGWQEGEDNCGKGILHQVEGITVMQTCSYPGIQEAIMDMSGAGSRYSMFSKMINVVLAVELEDREYVKESLAGDLKTMILRAAEYIGNLTEDAEPAVTEEVRELDEKAGLPGIGYVCLIQAQGPLRNVHLYGEDCSKMVPRFLKAEEMMDGALVSGNYIISCQKNPTYLFQSNPMVCALRKRAGTELNYKGTIISTESSLLEEKKRNAKAIADLAEHLELDGVIITQEGGGHADVDLMITLEECERKGIKVVIQTNEIAGQDGDLPPLVSTSALADAIVTNGNNDELIQLESVDKVIGGQDILNGKFNACDGFVTSLGILYTSTNQLGANSMRTIAL